ncbi:MAG: homoserine dehydrogenase, partial [Chloroflexota bacterium]|nr:homoserine dehydrogenase [Chloroflexota bacterium]
MGPTAMSAKPLGVGLLGLGTVGSAVARAFADRQKRVDAAAGRPVRLLGAAVRDPRKARDAGGVRITKDPFEILDDPDIGAVIEVIGGHQPAFDLLFAAFERGKHVVTANKEVVAKEWDTLHEAARLGHRELRFEAAVGGAVPVVRGVMELGAVRPRVLRGLLNGTTTYICSRLETGVAFADALREA